MKRKLIRVITVICAVVTLLQTVSAANSASGLPYTDVPQSRWSYSSIKTLYGLGVLPAGETLGCEDTETRANFVSYLYAVAKLFGEKPVQNATIPFTDISAEDAYYEACAWAWKNDIIKGVNATSFAPNAYITRQDICVIMLRFARHMKLQFSKRSEPVLFTDAFRVSSYARSAVVACRMIGLIDGYENGFFRPSGNITREECAAVVCRLYRAAKAKPSEGSELVNTGEGAYDELYSAYTQFQSTLPLSSEVSLDYFADTVFVGDSVSVMLQYYCTATKALGNAKFLCAGSLSATNALGQVTQSSVHPSYQGKKMKVEDGVAASGAKKVYIMLGINNISYGLTRSTSDMVKLIERILEKSPHVKIIIQSVTPMSAKSNILSKSLNNDTIAAYNRKMEEICVENGWYFVNVAEAFRDAEGYLPAKYCSDYSTMGIHFNNNAVENWISYLKTHALTTK